MTADTLLPLEVIWEIFSNVDDDDKTTLSACSQTSSWFRLDIQRRIFTSVRLEYLAGRDAASDGKIWLVDLHQESRAIKFLSAITQVPRLGTFVRQLSLGAVQSKIQADLTTASLLELLPRITHLEQFTFDNAGFGPIKFAHLALPIQDVLRSTLGQLKDLTHIDLSGLSSIPFTLISHSPKLVSLSFVSLSDNDQNTRTRNGSVGPTKLKLCNTVPWTTCSEQLSELVQLLKEKNSPLSLSNLHTLIVETHKTVRSDVTYLLSCAPVETLRTLTLSRPETDAYDPIILHVHPGGCPPFDLQPFRYLAQLNLSMGQLFAIFGYEDSKTPLPWVATIIKSLPVLQIDDNRNPRLSLKLTGTIFSSAHHLVKYLPWELVAEVLLHRRAEFKEIQIEITVISPKSDTSSTFTSAQKTIEALKSHPIIQVLVDFVKFQYLEQIIYI